MLTGKTDGYSPSNVLPAGRWRFPTSGCFQVQTEACFMSGGIFDAMKSLAVYTTSGERILLAVDLNGARWAGGLVS